MDVKFKAKSSINHQKKTRICIYFFRSISRADDETQWCMDRTLAGIFLDFRGKRCTHLTYLVPYLHHGCTTKISAYDEYFEILYYYIFLMASV